MTNLLQRFVDFATGEVTADVNNSTVTTGEASITNVVTQASYTGNANTITKSTLTQIALDTAEIEDSSVVDADLNNNKLILKKAGKYAIGGGIGYLGSTNWSTGDQIQAISNVGGSVEKRTAIPHGGLNIAYTVPLPSHFVEITSPPTDLILQGFHDSDGDGSNNEEYDGNAKRTFLGAEFVG